MHIKPAQLFAATIVCGLYLKAGTVSAEDFNSPLVDKGAVTFNVEAPGAQAVTVKGDFLWGQPPLPLAKNPQGHWSVTVEDLAPDFYTYSYQIDGVQYLDPRNNRIKLGHSNLENIFLVPGGEVEYALVQDVPKGEVRQLWYQSETLDRQRRMHVYVPPGYDQSEQDYPVLYLIHGGGESDEAWTGIGRANHILDNLIAAGEASPMLVVMPDGYLPFIGDSASAFDNPAAPEAIAERGAREQAFVDELMHEIVPLTERRFRVHKGAEHRALAGLSMGGAYTLEVLKQQPLAFDYYGIWSLGFFFLDAEQFASQGPALVGQADNINAQVELIEVVVGDDDFALPGAQRVAAALAAHNIDHQFVTTDGGHAWTNWRDYYRRFVRRIFP